MWYSQIKLFIVCYQIMHVLEILYWVLSYLSFRGRITTYICPWSTKQGLYAAFILSCWVFWYQEIWRFGNLKTYKEKMQCLWRVISRTSWQLRPSQGSVWSGTPSRSVSRPHIFPLPAYPTLHCEWNNKNRCEFACYKMSSQFDISQLTFNLHWSWSSTHHEMYSLR